ncbi:MAG: ABC transporter ATP-binding protein [Actinomycetota bacterium]
MVEGANPIVRVVDVSKRFNLHHDKSLKERLVNVRKGSDEDFWALRGVGFDLAESNTLGLIGANGSGKSTLLKLIAGILTPTTGYVERRGRMAALLELGAGFHPDLTGRENVYMNASILGLTRRQTDKYFDDIVDFSGIEKFIDNQVKFYSSGMYVRLAFAVAVHVDPQLLLIDEVLAVGDEPFQRKCMKRIREFQRDGRTIVLVTHGIDTVRQLCDRVIMLDKGEIVVDGKPQEATRAFRERYAAQVEVQEDDRGTGQLTITGIRVTDGHGKDKARFESGERLGVEVMLDGHEPVEDPVVGVAIYNHLDTMIYGTNTGIRGVHMGTLSGKRRVRFDFGPIPMVEGQYFVTVAVHSRDEAVQYHWLERQISFKVFSLNIDSGVLHLDPKIEVDRI